MGQIAKIEEVLLVERLVEIIGLLDVVLDFGGQPALAVERSPRRKPHHEEGERDDDEQRGDRTHHAPNRIGEH